MTIHSSIYHFVRRNAQFITKEPQFTVTNGGNRRKFVRILITSTYLRCLSTETFSFAYKGNTLEGLLTILVHMSFGCRLFCDRSLPSILKVKVQESWTHWKVKVRLWSERVVDSTKRIYHGIKHSYEGHR